MLIHGRRSYRSNAEMVLYFLYKNLVMTFPHFFYAFYCCYTFVRWSILGIFHAAVVFFVPCIAFQTSGTISKNGIADDIWILSLSSFTSIIWVVNLKLFVLSRSVIFLQVLNCAILSFGIYFGYMVYSNYIEDGLQHAVIIAN